MATLTIFILSFLFVSIIQAVNKYTPTWITSNYIKSDCADVISNKTGNASQPSATIPFPGSAFTQVPNIGYGAFNYHGDDGLASEMFEINRTDVTTSSFSVLIQITGYTNINLMTIRFVAIDKDFPHHVNSYDNVPANYSAGPFVNISDQTPSINRYENIINFTQQSIGMTYNKFEEPMGRNKILLFVTSFFLTGINDPINQTNASLLNPVAFLADYQILTNETYKLVIQLGTVNKLDRLHFSMVIFYQEELKGISQYLLVYERFNIDRNGGFIKIPIQFVNNFMMGLTNFTSQRTRSIVFYSWSWTTYSGDYGLFMPVSTPYNLIVPAVNSYGFTYFYIKTWNCPADTYFNDTDNTCTQCVIIDCVFCRNFTVCEVCDTAGNFIANQTTGLCEPCALDGCLNCTVTNSTSPPSEVCYLCNSTDHYRLVGTTCSRCLTSQNYFLNTTTMQCQLCTLANCILCSSFTQCLTCDYNNSYGLITGTGTCQYCNNTIDSFLNTSNLSCQSCSLSNCLDCLSLTQCLTCDTGSGFFLNSNTSLCEACVISNCQNCSTLTACSICNSGYIRNPTTFQCELCNIANCDVCFSLTACSICDSGYFLNPNTSLCQACALSDCTTCLNLTYCSVCDANYFTNSNGTCESCSLSNCINCSSLTACSVCDTANGFFLNSTSSLCQACTLSNCITCSSLTACSVCDTASRFFLNSTSGLCELCTLSNCITCTSLTACSVCDTANGFFLNSTSGLCQVCSLAHCLTCTSLTSCSVCNETSDHFLNGSSLCDPCSLSNCLDCHNSTACLNCSLPYFLNGTSSVCQACSLANCNTCTSLTSCLICNTGYFLNTTSYLCETCSVPNCITCASISTCSDCDTANGYFLNSSTSLCQLCSLSNCINCSSLTACSVCDTANGFFLNSTSSLCQACTLSNCITCSSLTACSVCDTASRFFLNSTSGLCELCTLSNCITCTSLTACSVCDTANGFFLNSTSGLCQVCSLAHCLTCTSLTSCSVCNETSDHFLNGSSLCDPCSLSNCLDCHNSSACITCNNIAGYFINSSNGLCQSCAVTNCLTCSSLTICSVCDQSSGFFMNPNTSQCDPCLLTNCTQCSNLTVCSVCDLSLNAVLNQTSGLCQYCPLEGCLTCQSIDVCSICDLSNSYGLDWTTFNRSLCGSCNVSCVCDGYVEPWDHSRLVCSSQCGDGLIRVDEQCDDNNTNSSDGCSSQCRIEPYSVCSGQPSICNVSAPAIPPTFDLQKQGCNQFRLSIDLTNLGFDLSVIDISILNQGVTTKSVTRSEGEKFLLRAEYSRSLVSENIEVGIGNQVYYYSYSELRPLLFYSSQQCKTKQEIDSVVDAVTVLSYITLLASLISCKIVGIELFGLLQLTYHSLISYDFLVLYLEPISKFKIFNGFNTQIFAERQEQPSEFKFIGFSTSFLNNCNIMLLVMIAQIFVSIMLYALSRILTNEKLKKISLRLLRQGFLTLFLFNILNISFSTGAFLRFTDNNHTLEDYLTLFAIIASILLGLYIIRTFVYNPSQEYGQYVNKFKNNFVCRLYIPLTIVYRAVVGIYIASHYDQMFSTLIVLAFSMSFLLYNIVNLPFSDAAQNYRSNFIHVCQLVALLIANYYRSMKSTTPLQIKGYIFLPAIILVCLVLISVVLSFTILVYEIIKDIRKWLRQKKTSINPSNTQIADVRNSTEQSQIYMH